VKEPIARQHQARWKQTLFYTEYSVNWPRRRGGDAPPMMLAAAIAAAARGRFPAMIDGEVKRKIMMPIAKQNVEPPRRNEASVRR